MLSLGVSENQFNKKVVDEINQIPCSCADKIPGTKFKGGLPDIVGVYADKILFLENKFSPVDPDRIRPKTLIFGHGAKKDWSATQRKTLERYYKATSHGCIGGLVGIITPNQRPNRHLILGVPVHLILAGLGMRWSSLRTLFKEEHSRNPGPHLYLCTGLNDGDFEAGEDFQSLLAGLVRQGQKGSEW